MARTKLDLPDTFRFSTELTVRVGDINYGQHLGNDAVLALAHEARLRFLETHGFSEMDAGGASLIMLDAVVVYKAQAYRGDVVRIEVDARDPGPAGFEFLYRLARMPDGAEIARVKTGMAFFNYKTNRLARMPEPFRQLFAGA